MTLNLLFFLKIKKMSIKASSAGFCYFTIVKRYFANFVECFLIHT